MLILQHPLEAGNPKGSARLLHLSLPRSRMATGEAFDPQRLASLLTGPWGSAHAAGSLKQPILLYPDTPCAQAPSQAAAAFPAPVSLQQPVRLRLVVLDGTWRKSLKMLHGNPLLQQLPRMALRELPASHYLIRRAHRPDQLSTLEATCAALAQLQGPAEPFLPLLAAFDSFVAWQMGLQTPGKTGGD
ncbi:MAG: domain containing protein [Polaromonas sp.]|nr:domain containing protein [Polaromonas sp.]